MGDLIARLRAAVEPGEADDLEPFIRGLQRAVLAALDAHPHISAAGVPDPLPDPFPDLDDDNAGHLSVVRYPGGKGFGCTACHYWVQGAVRDYGWCVTVRAIADALQIGVDDE